MKTATTTTTVTVNDLATEFKMAPRKVRIIIRSLGINAPAITQDGFGPRAKYEWTSDSTELATIKKSLKNPPTVAKTTKTVKSTKTATPAVTAEPAPTDDFDEINKLLDAAIVNTIPKKTKKTTKIAKTA